ncbi:MAG TPA: XRE family transcriptional regulator [Gemmatimonadaceae bacterium]
MSVMTPERIGRRIKWFREQRDLTQDEIAKSLGFKDRQTLSDIEAGKRKVSPGELVALTQSLRVDLDEVLDPFRLVGEGGFNFRVGEVEREAVEAFAEQAGRWIATYRELGRQAGVATTRLGQKLELTRESSLQDAAASAEALRAQWNLGDVPAETLERALERELGTLVLFVDAPSGVSGAASHLPGLQTILVNRSEPASRRAFDLAHELFHILTWDAMPPARIEGWEPKPTKGNHVERLANKFAACLLMPEPVVRARWATRGDVSLRDWLVATARSLRVSPTALQWQIHNLGLLGKPEMVDVTGNGGDPFAPEPPLFSASFIARVHEAVEGGRLSLRRAAGLLGLSLGAFADVCRSYGRPLSYDA